MTVATATAKAVTALINRGARTATVYLSDARTVRATRRLYGGKAASKVDRTIDIVLTIGKPNYKAREFIKSAKRAGEPFPVRKVQLGY